MDERMLIHPGEVLKEDFMAPLGLSASRLAAAIDVPTNRITEIINGTRRVTGETALLLGHVCGTTPDFWLNLQTQYDLDRAKGLISEASLRRADQFRQELVHA
jgi:addiction module HigA family antidote